MCTFTLQNSHTHAKTPKNVIFTFSCFLAHANLPLQEEKLMLLVRFKLTCYTLRVLHQVPYLTKNTTWESDKNTIKHHKQEPRGQPFPSRWPQGIKYLFKKWMPPKEVHENFIETFGKESPSYSTVKNWTAELGASEMVHFYLVLMNRLNKPSLLFSYM